MKTFQSWLNENLGSKWKGNAELWMDPEGNDAKLCECSLVIDSGGLSYTWAYEAEIKTGAMIFKEEDATWLDSWHQPEHVKCNYVSGSLGLVTLEYSYSAPPGPDWGWRIKLSQRPDDSLVLQMTNITPWGEEGRAVRMIFQKESSYA